MEDTKIVELYWRRDETAIAQTDAKYGSYCRSIAGHILQNQEDAEESVNDTYLAAWHTMPPNHPSVLSAFLGKLTRRISIDRWRQRSAQKRGGDAVTLALEELEGCVSGAQSAEEEMITKEMIDSINRFLATLPKTQRQIFLLRYWYIEPVEKIAHRFGFSANYTAVLLHRVRKRLREYLRREGYV